MCIQTRQTKLALASRLDLVVVLCVCVCAQSTESICKVASLARHAVRALLNSAAAALVDFNHIATITSQHTHTAI